MVVQKMNETQKRQTTKYVTNRIHKGKARDKLRQQRAKAQSHKGKRKIKQVKLSITEKLMGWLR